MIYSYCYLRSNRDKWEMGVCYIGCIVVHCIIASIYCLFYYFGNQCFSKVNCCRSVTDFRVLITISHNPLSKHLLHSIHDPDRGFYAAKNNCLVCVQKSPYIVVNYWQFQTRRTCNVYKSCGSTEITKVDTCARK